MKNGEFVKNGTLYDMYFDAEGRYTTGNADLDAQLNAIVEAQTNDSMTLEQKLRALFDYVVKNYTYLARPMVAKGTANWEPEYAQFFLNNKKGNCFSFAAAYCLLSRELGCHLDHCGRLRQAHRPPQLGGDHDRRHGLYVRPGAPVVLQQQDLPAL